MALFEVLVVSLAFIVSVKSLTVVPLELEPTFFNSGSTWQLPRVIYDANDECTYCFVELEGTLFTGTQTPTDAGTIIARLPSGVPRPPRRVFFSQPSAENPVRLDIWTDGTIRVKPFPDNDDWLLINYVSFDGMKYSIQATGSPSTVPSNVAYSVKLTDAYENNGAACLDGSVPHYYYREGFVDETNDGRTKYFIFLEGGGWCAGLTDPVSSAMNTCLQRSTGTAGTTLNDPASRSLTGDYFSQDKNTNPVLYNWNVVFLRYCDGASFTGNVTDPVEVTTTSGTTYLYFRGHQIISGLVEDLFGSNKYPTPTEVILGGCSAGGLATYLNADFVFNKILDEYNIQLTNYGAMPDSGFFMDYQSSTNYPQGIEWVYQNQNSYARLNTACTNQFSANEQWKCMLPQYFSSTITTRVFALQSQYDSWKLINILGGTSDATANTNFGATLSNELTGDLGTNSDSGWFLSSCYYHCNRWNNNFIDGQDMAQAMYQWYYGSNLNISDDHLSQIVPWNERTCS